MKKKHKKQPVVGEQIIQPNLNSTEQPNSLQAEGRLKKNSRKNWIIAIVSLISAILVVTLISTIIWYQVQLGPKTVADVYHIIEVKSGETTFKIAEDLENNGVINSSTAFLWYVKINRINNLQAGTYRFSSADTTPKIAKTLKGGDVSTVDLLILPGQRLSQIKQKLINAGYSKQDIENALVAIRSHPLLKGVPKNEPLEGYLFPDTYKIAPNTSVEQLMNIMLDNFQSKITPKILSGLKKQGLSLRQGIILASIVQKEVADPANEKIVAQVFLKRLEDGNVLGSDVTFQYAAAETGQTASPDLISPYNTRKVAGLPPTAIANFNLSALEAVVNPAKTTYNYFVAGDDGKVYYSTTEEEHVQQTKAHCASCYQ